MDFQGRLLLVFREAFGVSELRKFQKNGSQVLLRGGSTFFFGRPSFGGQNQWLPGDSAFLCPFWDGW